MPTKQVLARIKDKDFLEEGAPIQVIARIKDKDLLEEGVPSFAPARLGNRSCAITQCCPPVAKAGMAITFANALAAAQTNWW